MHPTTTLPPNYRRHTTLDLSQSKAAVAVAIILGIVLLLGTGWAVDRYARWLRPDTLAEGGLFDLLTVAPDGSLAFELPLLEVLLAIALMTMIHEGLHGLIFWWFGGKRPRFGFKGLLFYTAAPPDVYFPRNPYLIVGLAPFVDLTVIGLLLIPFAPPIALTTIGLFIAFNAAGSAGDLVMAARLLACPADALMQDHESGVAVYVVEGGKPRGGRETGSRAG